jgi:ABC-type multidrug transport system fused ATPase/permease subunit
MLRTQALIGTTFLIVLWQGGHQPLRGQISLGALISFNAYLTPLVWPMIALGWGLFFAWRGVWAAESYFCGKAEHR